MITFVFLFGATEAVLKATLEEKIYGERSFGFGEPKIVPLVRQKNFDFVLEKEFALITSLYSSKLFDLRTKKTLTKKVILGKR